MTVPGGGREGNGTAILENLLTARKTEDEDSSVSQDASTYSRETLAQVSEEAVPRMRSFRCLR